MNDFRILNHHWPEDGLKNELNTMHEVSKCKGKNFSEKIDNYLESCDLKNKYSHYRTHYRIKHR